jgi:hypothetical protein
MYFLIGARFMFGFNYLLFPNFLKVHNFYLKIHW